MCCDRHRAVGYDFDLRLKPEVADILAQFTQGAVHVRVYRAYRTRAPPLNSSGEAQCRASSERAYLDDETITWRGSGEPVEVHRFMGIEIPVYAQETRGDRRTAWQSRSQCRICDPSQPVLPIAHLFRCQMLPSFPGRLTPRP